MAEELNAPKLEEEKTNGRGKSKSGSGTTRKRKTAGRGTSGDETGNLGGSAGEQGTDGSESGEVRKESGDSGDERKRQILERLKGKRNQGNLGTSDEKHNGSEGVSTGVEWGDNRTPEGIESVGGIDSGQVAGLDDVGREFDVDNSDVDGSSTDSGSKTRKRKIKGVEFELPVFDKEKPTPAIDKKEQQLEDELTQKESKELQPRIENALKALFSGMDRTIDMTTKNRVGKVNIWSSIEDFEITIIATSLLETGQKSKVVSTITRRMASDYTKLQMGIILLPKFIDMYSHYMTNGFGFGFSQQISGGTQ